MNITHRLACIATAAMLLPASCALAQQPSAAPASPSPWSFYAGYAHIGFSASATVKVNGAEVNGGNASAADNSSLAFGVIYHFDERWSAELAMGLPPTATLSGADTLSSAGKLGKVTYGPAVLSLRHSFLADGPVRPYIGAGINYTHVFSTDDGFVRNLKVKSAFGPVLQLGVAIPLKDRWSLLLDVKKIWVSTTATGTLPAFGGAATTSDVRLDPLVSTLTLSYSF